MITMDDLFLREIMMKYSYKLKPKKWINWKRIIVHLGMPIVHDVMLKNTHSRYSLKEPSSFDRCFVAFRFPFDLEDILKQKRWKQNHKKLLGDSLEAIRYMPQGVIYHECKEEFSDLKKTCSA